jgi:glycine C-acetyltransferase
VRLCKARRYRYANCDMADLEAQLKQAGRRCAHDPDHHRRRVLDGRLHRAAGRDHCAGAKYGALVHIDECHATGFLGATGRGSAEVTGVMEKIDIFTGTLGKALGGALGGFTTAARKEVIELLRQRSRPYLFSNSLPPPWSPPGIKAFEMLSRRRAARTLRENTRHFRTRMVRRLRHQARRAPDRAR